MKKNPPPAVPYRYRPVQFYLLVFGFTWLFWVAAALTKDNALAMGLMLLGLLVPPALAVVFVFTSRSATLRRDFKRKLAGFARLRLWTLPVAVLGTGYVLNFLISVLPLGFSTTWVYVKNNRSMLASILFHLFVNFFQEKIAMTPKTKCIETAVIALAAVVVVLVNRDLFFEQRHVGDLLGELAPKGPKV